MQLRKLRLDLVIILYSVDIERFNLENVFAVLFFFITLFSLNLFIFYHEYNCICMRNRS